jgi:16S rRNA (guanine527-N7)-methyltransferase
VDDSLAALDLERVRGSERMADIGTGAGFPGLVLAIALPRTRVTLVERKEERHRFLRRAIAALELSNVELVTVPVQQWRAGLRAYDLVTVRNVAPLNVVVELAAPLLVVGGAAVLWGPRRRRPAVEAEGDAAAAAIGLRLADIREPGTRRNLHVYEKVSETPSRFPRPRQGAFRDPLGTDVEPEQWVPDVGRVRLSAPPEKVLELMAEGESDRTISEVLDLPYATTRQEIRRLKRKFAAKTREEAVARARGCGLLPG